MLCLHILQSSLAFINTLMIQDYPGRTRMDRRPRDATARPYLRCSTQHDPLR